MTRNMHLTRANNKESPVELRSRSRSMMAAVMNRLLRPFGLKLGPLQAGAFYFPLHFLAVGIGLTLLIAPQGVGVFWPATGSLFAFLLLYPARYWLALFVASYARGAAGTYPVRATDSVHRGRPAVPGEVRGGAARRGSHARDRARPDFIRPTAPRVVLCSRGPRVHAALRVRRHALRGDETFGEHDLLARRAELVDRRFPGRAHHHAAGCSPSASTASRSRSSRAAAAPPHCRLSPCWSRCCSRCSCASRTRCLHRSTCPTSSIQCWCGSRC